MTIIKRAPLVSLLTLISASALARPGMDLLEADRDNDGRISAEEFRLPQGRRGGEPFERADSNEDGVVSRDELLVAIEEGEARRREHMLARFDSADTDGDGVVTRDEAKSQAFAHLDRDGDGYITEQELRPMFLPGDGRPRRERREPVGDET